MSLRGKIILVTGAANGMGEATARRLGVEGARVVLTDVETDRLAEAAKSIADSGADVLQYELDVTNRAQVQAVFDQVESKWGVPYGVAHIAGIGVPEPFLESTDKVWDKTIAVNLTGTFYVSQVAARGMVKAKIAGSIVLMAST